MFSLVECSSCPSYVKIYKKTLASEDTSILLGKIDAV